MYSLVEELVKKGDFDVTLCVVKNMNLKRSIAICINLNKFMQVIENKAGLGCAR